MAYQPGQNFGDILLGFDRTLRLEGLAEFGRQANLVPVEVVSCVVDIRGFTRFVQNDQAHGLGRAPEFIREFFSIFPKAVLRETWNLESADRQQPPTYFQVAVGKLVIPRLAKKMGDGVLLVWELDGCTTHTVKQGLRYAIIDIVGYIQEYFYNLIRQRRAAFPDGKWDMDLGIGLAGGQAWRHDYERGGEIDYSGPPMNLASRLQDMARPKGVCIHAPLEANYLLERTWAGEGNIKTVKVKGVDDPVHVWLSTEETLWLRRSRRPQGANPSQLKALFTPPFFDQQRSPRYESCRRGLCEDDLKTLLQIRENLEADFAGGAAKRSDANSKTRLKSLIADMKKSVRSANGKRFRLVGQRFHETIAFSSGRTQRDAKEHSELVRSLHKWTTNNNYPQASADLSEMLKEHSEIAAAINNKDPELAADKMHQHLQKHHNRVKEKAFGTSAI